VNFRLSEDEFEKLRSSCSSHGARSISDFARSSVLRRLEEAPGTASLPNQLACLDLKVSELGSRVGELLRLFEPGRQAGEIPRALEAREATSRM
jgi:hypothetical protein